MIKILTLFLVFLLHFIPQESFAQHSPVDSLTAAHLYSSTYIDARRGEKIALEDFEEFIVVEHQAIDRAPIIFASGKIDLGFSLALVYAFAGGKPNLPVGIWLVPDKQSRLDSVSVKQAIIDDTNGKGCYAKEDEDAVVACFVHRIYRQAYPNEKEEVWLNSRITHWRLDRNWFSENEWIKIELDPQDAMIL